MLKCWTLRQVDRAVNTRLGRSKRWENCTTNYTRTEPRYENWCLLVTEQIFSNTAVRSPTRVRITGCLSGREIWSGKRNSDIMCVDTMILLCGNKIPTRCNRWFLYCRYYCLLNMCRAPLCPSSGAQKYYTGGCCLWFLVLWFSSFRSGVEQWVVCPVCGMRHNGARNMLSKQ